MSNRKDRQDDNFHVYPSDYIDYRPSSTRAKKATSLLQNLLKMVLIAGVIIILLLILSRLHNPYSLAEFPESFAKIALDASTLNNELDELTKQFANSIKEEAPRLDENTLQEIQLVKKNLDYAALYSKVASQFLESGSNRLTNICK